MAANIKDFEISKTFANVILSNIDEQPDTDGIPFDLSTAANRTQGRLQDGLGNSSPLYLSRTSVEVTTVPETPASVARKQEILEGITYFQTASLIYG
jgi:hypothetical protein